MDLAVQNREKFGKAAKSLRKEGLIPAELYGRGIANVHLAVPSKEFNKVYKEAGENTVVNLLVGKDLPAGPLRHGVSEASRQGSIPALIYEVGRDYLSGEVAHVDFYQVRMDEKIKAKIPLEFSGEALAVKDKGAILNKSMLEIEVEALPANLPHRLTVDLSLLKDLNESIYVKDIKVPQGIKVLIGLETVVMTATPPVAEEVKVVEETPIDVTAVKVETEEKKAERAAEKEKLPKEPKEG